MFYLAPPDTFFPARHFLFEIITQKYDWWLQAIFSKSARNIEHVGEKRRKMQTINLNVRIDQQCSFFFRAEQKEFH